MFVFPHRHRAPHPRKIGRAVAAYSKLLASSVITLKKQIPTILLVYSNLIFLKSQGFSPLRRALFSTPFSGSAAAPRFCVPFEKKNGDDLPFILRAPPVFSFFRIKAKRPSAGKPPFQRRIVLTVLTGEEMLPSSEDRTQRLIKADERLFPHPIRDPIRGFRDASGYGRERIAVPAE